MTIKSIFYVALLLVTLPMFIDAMQGDHSVTQDGTMTDLISTSDSSNSVSDDSKKD